MIRRIAQRLLPAVLVVTCATAQDTTVFFEDFESGLPAGWTTFNQTALQWRAVANGECGAVTGMVACNFPGSCDYVAPNVGQATLLVSPQIFFPSTNTTAALFSFDYILDIDASGDHLTVAIDNISAAIYPFLAELHLVDDGARHTVTLDMDFAVGGPFHGNTIVFQFTNDGAGDQGRGVLIDNVRLSVPSPADAFCSPSAAAPCPCPSGGVIPSRGCPNSLGFGARLRGAGNPSVSADTYQLTAYDLPPGAVALFFEGSTTINIPFGDGRRCVGSPIQRLGITAFANGTPVLPDVGQVPISVRSSPTAGATRFYQVYYRDPAGPCGSTFNLTNAWRATWGP